MVSTLYGLTGEKMTLEEFIEKHKLKIWNRLVPRCKTIGCQYDNSLKWADERPEPNTYDMEIAARELQKELDKAEKIKEIESIKNYAINNGVLYEGYLLRADTEFIRELEIMSIAAYIKLGTIKELNMLDFNKNIIQIKTNKLNTLIDFLKNNYANIMIEYYNNLNNL